MSANAWSIGGAMQWNSQDHRILSDDQWHLEMKTYQAEGDPV